MCWLGSNDDKTARVQSGAEEHAAARYATSQLVSMLITILIITITITAQTSNVKCHPLTYSTSINPPPPPPPPPSPVGISRHLRGHNLVHHQAEAPEFTEPIGNHTVPLGRDAQLSCKISNLGAYRTAWLRVEDKGILTIHTNVITRNYRFGLINDENERNFVLTIKNVQPSDKGGYMCQINSVPMKSAIGYLDVLTPPVFDDATTTTPSPLASGEYVTTSALATSSPDDLSSQQQVGANSSQTTVVEGASATLTCRASGHPVPSITWRREDGRPILLNGALDSSSGADADGSGAPTEIKDTATLNFKTASRLTSGAYLCIASNGVQPSASKRQLLDVQFAPVITLPQTEVAAHLGQREARLECLVELNPHGSYHWIKLATSTTNTDRRPMAVNQEDDLWLIEHDELTQSDKFDIVIRQINSEKVHMTLTIRRVERHDFSWYKCIAKNQLGLQSNFIRFYESTTVVPPANTLASSTSAPTSSFSFNSIFRGGGGSQPDDKLMNLPQNDDSRQSGGGAASHEPRAHSRSSWNQRSTGSTASSRSSASKLSAGGGPLVNLLTLFLCPSAADNCHLLITTGTTTTMMASYLISIMAAAVVPLIASGALLTRSAQQITLRPT